MKGTKKRRNQVITTEFNKGLRQMSITECFKYFKNLPTNRKPDVNVEKSTIVLPVIYSVDSDESMHNEPDLEKTIEYQYENISLRNASKNKITVQEMLSINDLSDLNVENKSSISENVLSIESDCLKANNTLGYEFPQKKSVSMYLDFEATSTKNGSVVKGSGGKCNNTFKIRERCRTSQMNTTKNFIVNDGQQPTCSKYFSNLSNKEQTSSPRKRKTSNRSLSNSRQSTTPENSTLHSPNSQDNNKRSNEREIQPAIPEKQRPSNGSLGNSSQVTTPGSHPMCTPNSQNNYRSHQKAIQPATPEEQRSSNGSLCISSQVTTPEHLHVQTPNSPNINKRSHKKEKQKSPKKQKTENEPSFNSSQVTTPRKTPIKVKTFKAKEGKQLQTKQLEILTDLFRNVKREPHLRYLLGKEESKLLFDFFNASDNTKYAMMKLYVWKRTWYNIFSFCNKANIEVQDDKDIIEIFQDLARMGFVHTEYSKDGDLLELLHTLTQDKITEIMKEMRIKSNKAKADNIRLILETASKQKTLPCTKTYKEIVMSKIKDKMGFSFKITDEAYKMFYNICLLITFVNPEFQDIQNYFKSIIYNRTVFPTTSIEKYLIFVSRRQFLQYADALKIQKTLVENKESKMDILQIGTQIYKELQNIDIDERDKEAPHLYRFRAEHIYYKILTECCERLFTKKTGYPEEVKKWLEYLISKFPQSEKIGKWYSKLIWLHMHCLNEVNYEMAARLLISVLSNTKYKLNIISLYDLVKLGGILKKSKQHKIPQLYHDEIAGLMPRSVKETDIPREQINSNSLKGFAQSSSKKKYITKTSDGVIIQNVEQVALTYYNDNGYPEGMHCESSLMTALFLLFFWDIIYDPPIHIAGVFVTPIQTAPLDIFTEYFYENRKDLFTGRLSEISSKWSLEESIQFATTIYQEHSHESSVFGLIENIIPEKETVSVLVKVIGQKLLSKIFERLASDLRAFRSGMPDLFLYNVEQKKCKFVEVKSDNDRLAINQLLWLKYLKENGADVAVCWVHSIGSKTKHIKGPQTVNQN